MVSLPAALRGRSGTFVCSRALVVLAILFVPPVALSGQSGKKASVPRPSVETSAVPALAPYAATPRSELAQVVARYDADQEALGRRYGVDYSPARAKRLEAFTTQ
jgi:hypothetical protein